VPLPLVLQPAPLPLVLLSAAAATMLLLPLLLLGDDRAVTSATAAANAAIMLLLQPPLLGGKRGRNLSGRGCERRHALPHPCFKPEQVLILNAHLQHQTQAVVFKACLLPAVTQ
jgi:hypothetical protein